MSSELRVLAFVAIWQMIVFVLYAVRANRELGPGYTLSPRDRAPGREMTTRTARLGRAYDNHVEWLLLFAVAVGIVEWTGQNSAFTAACAWAYLLARLIYVPAYAFGLSPWRSAIWSVGFVATLLMLLAALI